MKSFAGDSYIKEQVGVDMFQFLKGPVEKEKSIRILDDKITDLLREPSGRDLVEKTRSALPARQ
jgi:hypothetical protein